MSRRFNIAYFAHSVRSDWNNGNAHFLRGLLNSLQELGQRVVVYEPADAWSMQNLLLEDLGVRSLERFSSTYPYVSIISYDSDSTASSAFWLETLTEIDIVIVHEWNPPELTHCLLKIRADLDFCLVFHDTHHRASSSPDRMRAFRVDLFDGVLAFGEALRSIYREKFGIEKVWTLHEAADTSVFTPRISECMTDVIWIGNWGDGERTAEIRKFLLEPASRLPGRHFTIYGVRYPVDGLDALREASVRYGGYLQNLDAPNAYASAALTVHIPRQQYVQALTGIPTIRMFEALACGIPLISAPWHDSEGLFRREDYLSVRNADEMCTAMDELLNDPKLRHAQAASGLETVLRRHTCRHRAQQLIDILEELS